ncbi:MAG TPA: ribosome silencing factor [Bacteroidetes bacterium]|nr:ribosome silencing factor [Bacteroidota bacterium]
MTAKPKASPEKASSVAGARRSGWSRRLARQLAKYTLEKKAYDVMILDLRKLTDVTDFFVLCSADSDTQVKAIVDHIDEKMRRRKLRPWHVEGYENLRWVLLDFVDVVVHVFQRETREFYSLETLWGDAKTEIVEDGS